MIYIPDLPDVPLTTIDGEPLRNGDKPRVLSLREFIRGRTADPVFGLDMEAVLAAVRIREAIGKPGDCIEIESTDFQRLAVAVKTPKAGYNIAIAHCLVDFMQAVISATSKRPEPKALPAAAE